MEQAIELKKNNLKMFETANEVGIPDPNYFGRCFKKYTGISYSEYI
jgi:YesN/AraC family two-component response regulator